MLRIKSFIDAMDQPTIDGFNTFVVSSVAKDVGLKAILSGIGADELFYGYNSFRNVSMLKRYGFIFKNIYPFIQSFNAKYEKLSYLESVKTSLRYYLVTRAIFSVSEISKILDMDISEINQVLEELESDYSSVLIDDELDAMSYYELSLYMRNQLLRDADIFGMASSLEIRVPFLDKKLVSYVTSLGPSTKQMDKELLKKSANNFLPKKVIYREKMGFGMPFDNWISSNQDLFKGFSDNSLVNRYKGPNSHWSKLWLLTVINEKFLKI